MSKEALVRDIKVLSNYEELNGKTVVFTHMAEFADQVTIATEDGYILMVSSEISDEFMEQRIKVYNKYQVLKVLTDETNRYLREELDRLGIFNLEDYKKFKEEKDKEEKERRKKAQVAKEREQLERLQEKRERGEI